MHVPHFHKLLFALVDIGKFVNHLADFLDQPRRINSVLISRLSQSKRRLGEARIGVVIQPEKRKQKCKQTLNRDAHGVIPVVTGNEGSGTVREGSVEIVLLSLQELAQAWFGPLGLGDDDVGDAVPLDRSEPGEDVARWLADHVMGVANVGRVEQLRD